jgi:uncharacterized protein (TIGR02217 family)
MVTIDNSAIFPEGISYGSRGGPGFRTLSREVSNGRDFRIARSQYPRLYWDVAENLRRPSASGTPAVASPMAEILDFYHAREGATRGFRFRDWTDWTTHHEHNQTPDLADYRHRHILGAGDGSTTQFQLVKWYRDAGIERPRPITRPIPSGEDDRFIAVWLDGSLQTETTHYSLSDSTGVVTFVTAPTKGLAVEASFTFHVPARFGVELDARYSAVYRTSSAWDIPSIPIVEEPEMVNFAEGRARGGYTTVTLAGTATQLSLADGMTQEISTTNGSRVAYLPDLSEVPVGGPFMYLINGGGVAFPVKDFNGNTVITSFPATYLAELYKRTDGTVLAA